jgi:hypothetical protein
VFVSALAMHDNGISFASLPPVLVWLPMRLGALLLALGLALQARAAVAQTDEALGAARRLFTEAVADESAKRYEAALDKFRQVAAVRETANVRYRIATCLEALGHDAEALASYESAVNLGASEPAASDVVQVARERAAKLDAAVARLVVELPARPPEGLEVRVDGAPIDASSLAAPAPIVLDPGHHTLSATARGRVPFETAVVLQAGSRVSIAVTLPEAAPAPAPSLAPTPSSATPSSADVDADGSNGRRTVAWISLGVGGALAAGSIVSFVLQESNLSTLHRDCATKSDGNLSCPQSAAGEVNAAHDAAQVEGPLAIGLAAGAVVAVGVGAWLLATSPRAGGAAMISPTFSTQGAGFVVRGAFEGF